MGSVSHAEPAGARIDPELQAALQSLGPDETISVIVTLRDQANLRLVPQTNLQSRNRAVVTALRAKADSTQRGLRSLLQQRLGQGEVKEVIPFWVFNGLAVNATKAVILELAARPEVLSIALDAKLFAPQAPPEGAAAPRRTPAEPDCYQRAGIVGPGVHGPGRRCRQHGHRR